MIGTIKRGIIERIEPANANPDFDPNVDYPAHYKPAYAVVKTEDGKTACPIPWGPWSAGDKVELVYEETATGADWRMRKS